jgi:hypothetical protein
MKDKPQFEFYLYDGKHSYFEEFVNELPKKMPINLCKQFIIFKN